MYISYINLNQNYVVWMGDRENLAGALQLECIAAFVSRLARTYAMHAGGSAAAATHEALT